MPSAPVEILSPDGDLAEAQDWLAEPSDVDSIFVVAIAGPQASGKSTLANALFNTDFPVAKRGVVGEATTRGILLSQVSATESISKDTLVLDVEGADARARGRDAKGFASRCAAFVTALADVVIVNLWFHDACRLDSAAYSLIRSILFTCADGLADGNEARTSLVIAVRDAEEDSNEALDELSSMIQHDVCLYLQFLHLCLFNCSLSHSHHAVLTNVHRVSAVPVLRSFFRPCLMLNSLNISL